MHVASPARTRRVALLLALVVGFAGKVDDVVPVLVPHPLFNAELEGGGRRGIGGLLGPNHGSQYEYKGKERESLHKGCQEKGFRELFA